MLKTFNLPEQWQKPLIVLLILLSVFVWTFAQSWLAIANIWQRSETYAHGFLVVPASLWLIWSQKGLLKNIRPMPSYWALLILSGAGSLWLVAVLSKVLVVEQFALVLMSIAVVWAVLGNQFVYNALFPLFFLFLMVPFGEDFVPYLMEYTASFVVAMLRLTGFSVYREGLHFTLTSGQWSVVEACSGIRYLIASVTLGLIYAYLNYSSYRKRTVFILLSVLVPILANGLRAYMIVMIGHLSSMKLATGFDHIIYGWLFFGLVMMGLFYVGSFWTDHSATSSAASLHEPSVVAVPLTSLIGISVVTLCCIAVWPVLAEDLIGKQSIQAGIPARLIQNGSDDGVDPNWGWKPQFKGVQAESLRFMANSEHPVGVYFANFGDESQGGELINSQNALISLQHRGWRVLGSVTRPMSFPAETVNVEESTLSNNQLDLLVLRWYSIGGHNTANPYYAKWLQLLNRLTGNTSPELMVVLYTETSKHQDDQARERLQKMALSCCG